MSPPFISFLTSACRAKRYVGETIDLVLPQTRPDWQLIAMKSGNSDEMAWTVEKYTGDLRIQLVRQKSLRVRGAVTAAADVATARYLCKLGSVRIDGGRER